MILDGDFDSPLKKSAVAFFMSFLIFSPFSLSIEDSWSFLSMASVPFWAGGLGTAGLRGAREAPNCGGVLGFGGEFEADLAGATGVGTTTGAVGLTSTGLGASGAGVDGGAGLTSTGLGASGAGVAGAAGLTSTGLGGSGAGVGFTSAGLGGAGAGWGATGLTSTGLGGATGAVGLTSTGLGGAGCTDGDVLEVLGSVDFGVEVEELSGLLSKALFGLTVLLLV